MAAMHRKVQRFQLYFLNGLTAMFFCKKKSKRLDIEAARDSHLCSSDPISSTI
jgi:hypothetical protein